jgi:AcrR family transcriptional regulator
MKVIAREAHISDGAIYKYFVSKEQLYNEAVVEPLKGVISDVFAGMAEKHPSAAAGRLEADQLLETARGYLVSMVLAFERVLPLLGMALFSETKRARRFYTESYAPTLESLGELFTRYYEPVDPNQGRLSAIAIMGLSLTMAIEVRNNKSFDLDEAVRLSIGSMFHPDRLVIEQPNGAARRRTKRGAVVG